MLTVVRTQVMAEGRRGRAEVPAQRERDSHSERHTEGVGGGGEEGWDQA